MQKRILVPLDGSQLAADIVQQVKRLLVRQDYEVVLLTVIEPPGHDGRIQLARGHLEHIRDDLIEKGALASTRVVVGDPVAEIVGMAERVQPELVCMATHGHGGLKRLTRGSVAEHVLRRCPTPVFLANPIAVGTGQRELRFDTILVPLDGSGTSLEVLPLVEDFARLYESEVLLLHVEWVPPLVAPAHEVPAPLPPPPEDVRAGLEPQVRALAAAGVAARALAWHGPIARTILDVAEREHVHLVAMSTHGRSGLARLVYGSVAEQVLRQCETPLLVRRVRLRPSGAPRESSQDGRRRTTDRQ